MEPPRRMGLVLMVERILGEVSRVLSCRVLRRLDGLDGLAESDGLNGIDRFDRLDWRSVGWIGIPYFDSQ